MPCKTITDRLNLKITIRLAELFAGIQIQTLIFGDELRGYKYRLGLMNSDKKRQSVTDMSFLILAGAPPKSQKPIQDVCNPVYNLLR